MLRAVAALTVFGAVGFARPISGPAPNDTWAIGERFAVVAGEPRAARVGLDVLRAGGNAVDAAVAVSLALAVTHPQAGNLGGGGFMLVRMADGETAAFDYRETAPARAYRDMFLTEDGSVHPENSLFGALAAGVPGSPAGLVAALEAFGTKALDVLTAPAIRLARDGFEVDHFLATALRHEREVLGRFPSTRAVFFRAGETLEVGDTLRQPDLADTLERFAEEGFDGFYRGETARRFAAHQAAAGGIIDADDLAGYVPVRREPLRGVYRGHEILSMPPPSSGGVALLQMLGMLEAFDVAGAGYQSAKSIHWLVEVMRRAYADRARWLGDPDHYAVPVEGLLAPDYLSRLRGTIAADRVEPVTAGRPAGAEESDDTTHFSIVDAEGNAVSCTTTINSTFGSGLVVDGLGFFLNNEMDDFSAKPGVPNQFGLIGGEANSIRPGKRMLSSMTPTIVLRDGKPRIVLGAPGGSRIITGVLQVVVNVLDHGMPLRHAIEAPRVHHQWKPEHVMFERNAISPDTRERLEAIGHTFAEQPRPSVGRVQAIAIRPDGVRVAVCDPRSGGAAVAR